MFDEYNKDQTDQRGFELLPCGSDTAPDILNVINDAAQVYRGAIPVVCWQDPYMTADYLEAEMAAGVVFTGFCSAGTLVGVMGTQKVKNVQLIRHAYVKSKYQGSGIGSILLDEIRKTTEGLILIGTWAAAEWAIRFYRRHGFSLVPNNTVTLLLRHYWDVPNIQIESSVVLSSQPLKHSDALNLIGTI